VLGAVHCPLRTDFDCKFTRDTTARSVLFELRQVETYTWSTQCCTVAARAAYALHRHPLHVISSLPNNRVLHMLLLAQYQLLSKALLITVQW
jgi:hypothetical protein